MQLHLHLRRSTHILPPLPLLHQLLIFSVSAVVDSVVAVDAVIAVGF